MLNLDVGDMVLLPGNREALDQVFSAFTRSAARAMRQVLIEAARRSSAAKDTTR